jgi:zinicin-like metallopeptidase
VSLPLLFRGVKNGTRGFRQGCRRNLGFAAGRVPQPHPECRDSSRGFSSESVTTPAGARKRLLLGIFHGVPATKRSVFNLPTGPDHIVLYQKNIEAVCSSEAEVRHQIRQTLIHELGHYFGMTEEQLKDV